MNELRRAGLVGAGVIGAGWASTFLAAGWDVVVHDPSAEAVRRLREEVEASWPQLEKLGLATGADPARLRVAPDIGACTREVDLVQENGPETASVKADLVATIDRACPPATPVVSSTSGHRPSVLQSWAPVHPERVLVGHPFHPVHLIPLVEIVPGQATDPSLVERLAMIYRSLGKRPVTVHREVPGHIANRLQAALWQEAYSLVERGVATVADVDAAIAHGPGLRWALLGPLVNQHLAGGAGGLAHTLRHLGPPAQEWMDDLQRVQLSDELASALVAGVDEELAEVDQMRMRTRRDELLVTLAQLKRDDPDLP